MLGRCRTLTHAPCTGQVFPDDFHLQTLETLLAVCPQLQPNVKVGGVLAGLMTRLAKYAADVPEVRARSAVPRAHLERLTLHASRLQVVPQFQSADAFGKFSAAIAKVVAVQTEMAVVDIVSMYSSLVTFALQARGTHRAVPPFLLLGANATAHRCTASNSHTLTLCLRAVPRLSSRAARFRSRRHVAAGVEPAMRTIEFGARRLRSSW